MLLIVLGVLSACTSLRSNQPDMIQPGALTDTTDQFAALTETYTPEAGSTTLPSIPTSTETDFQRPPATATAVPQIQPTEPYTPTFTPIPVTRFAVIGDFGLAGQPEADVASLVKSWEPELIITTGDNNYPDGEAETIDDNIGQYYQAFIHPYHGEYGPGAEVNRFFPTLGNHDWTTNQAQAHFDYFELPNNERYYDFVWGLVHFFAIDSDSREPDGVGRSSIQGQWLEQQLAASTAPWKVVYMHQPPYSSSTDGSIDWAQWPYAVWGATVVIAGHSHVYERLLIDDFPYFVNGLGGGPIYAFSEPISGSQVRFNDDYGAMLVEATPEKFTLQFITRGFEVIDTYSISR
jgi:hypothetical protein